MSNRRFAIVKPEVLWSGFPGNELRKQPAHVFKLATYLLTGPGVDLWGIWHVEEKVATLQLGMPPKVLMQAFLALQAMRWAFYQDGWVFVPDLPATQFTRWPLLPNDNNLRAAKNWYQELPENPFLGPWFDHHELDLSLRREPEIYRRGSGPVLVEGPGGPPGGEIVPSPDFDLLGQKIEEKPLTGAAIDVWFGRIAQVYPKKEKLHRGRQTLHIMRPTESLMRLMWGALQWQVKRVDWVKSSGRFAPSLESYFKDKRWLDTRTEGPRLNESTVELMHSAGEFIDDVMKEGQWTGRAKKLVGSPRHSPKLPS